MYEEVESAMCRAQSSGDGEQVNRSSPYEQSIVFNLHVNLEYRKRSTRIRECIVLCK